MGKKRGRKEMDQIDEIEYLKKGLRQALAKGDFKEVASLHNQLGNIYRLRGEFSEAIEHHKEEGLISMKHLPNDRISVAIAYRNIGECYLDMKKEEEATTYINRYLSISAREKDLVEEQRAHITLGRIALGLVDRYSENEANDPQAFVKRIEELGNAERQFTLAYEILSAGTIQGIVKDKELAAMKCGTYLNLGITQDLKDNSTEAIRWIERCISLAKFHGLTDDLHRAYIAMYTTWVKGENYKEAYATAKEVFKTAKALGNKLTEFEGRVLEAKALFLLNEMEKGVNILKRVRKQIKKNKSAVDLLEEIDPLLTAGVRILKAEDEYYGSDKNDLMKLKSLFELKGDNYVTIGNFRDAIKSYLQSIKHAVKYGLQGKPLAALYYSVAATYKDRGDYTNALKYFQEEMKILEGNRMEEFRTQTNIVECLEKGKHPQERIIDAHRLAIKLSDGFPKKQMVAYKNLSSYYKWISRDDLEAMYAKKAEDVAKLIKSKSGQSEEQEDDSQELNLFDDEIDLDELSSPESESENEEETDQPKNVVSHKALKMHRNEKGETRLHVEAQRGNVKAVRRLLAQGHEVNPRDFCGWIPLHEACNFGHYEVVVELLNHNANVNDTGGEKCNGLTPLHDASLNGHISVMRALLEHGANVLIRDKDGSRPIDTFLAWYESEVRAGNLTEEQNEECNEMKNCIIDMMKRAGKIYTEKDEKIARRKAAKRREPSPEFSLMRTNDSDDPVPVKICVVDPDENEGRAGVDEYSEAISILRRKDTRKFPQRPARHRNRSKSGSPSRVALLAESQYVGGDWMVPDENLAPEPSNNKRKRNPFDDLKIDDRQCTRRRKEGKRNSVAQMDVARSCVPIIKGGVSISDFSIGNRDREGEQMDIEFSNSGPDSNEPSSDIIDVDLDVDFNDNPDSQVKTCSIHSLAQVNYSEHSCASTSTGSEEQADITIISDDSDDGDFQPNSRQSLAATTTRRERDSLSKYSQPSNSTNRNRASLGLSRKRQTQTKLPFKRLSSTNLDLDSSPPSPHSQSSSSSTSLKNHPSFTKLDTGNSSTSLLRLKIDIMGTKILVPVLQQDQTIDWLCKETANRYHKESGSGMKLTLTLMTKDGAILSGTDTIRVAISENDTELTAKVENSTMVELHKRFDSTCKRIGVEPATEAVSALQRCESSEALILMDICLRGKINEALFLSIKHHFFLREISLSGCTLRDEGMKKLCSILPTLPKLDKLDLSCNGFTREGLTTFTDVFAKSALKNDPNYKPPLGLQNLTLSHNPLGNAITDQLSQLLKVLKNMKLISVRDCNLTAAFFSRNKKDFIGTINSCTIDNLDISFNLLGKGGLLILNTEITNKHIKIDSSFCE